MHTLSTDFFMNHTVWVAENLLGLILVRMTDAGSVLKGKIVETEAYLGLQDPCCHSFGGRRTDRTKAMYLPGGHIYVYFTYGMYHCFNIVTTKDHPEAVLIRAIEPLKGISYMRHNRLVAHNKKSLTKIKKNNVQLTNGPGKLCQAMDITSQLSGKKLGGAIYIETNHQPRFTHKDVAVSERVGLSAKQFACDWPLRFFIKDNPYVSKGPKV